MQAPPAKPVGKVVQGPRGWKPVLAFQGQLSPLGDAHPSRDVAEAAYDAGKLLFVLKKQPGRPLDGLKLHRPLATYTAHPRWAQLSGPHCSFEEACGLLAGGLAAEFLLPPVAVLPADGRRRRQAACLGSSSVEQQGTTSGNEEESAPSSGSEEWEGEGEEEDEEDEEECGTDEEADEEDSGRRAGQKRRRRGSQGGRPRGPPAMQRVPTGGKWAGLSPDGAASGSQGITMRLSHSEASGRSKSAHVPARYVRALAGSGTAGQVPPTAELTTPDGSTHSCSLSLSGRDREWFLGHIQHVLASLRPVAAGDRLRFTSTGRGAATVAMVRAAPAAQEDSARAAGGHERQGCRGGAVPAPAAVSRLLAGTQKRGGTSWRGLEPADSCRYSAALPATALSKGRVYMPDRYVAAAFGLASMPGPEPVEVTATNAADGSVHTAKLVMYGKSGALWLSNMRSLLGSLGAAPGDSLCLEPAGPLAVQASLVKGPADAAAAAPGDGIQEVATVPRIRWQGLEPTDSRRYTIALPATAFKMGQLSIPARYCVAAFGQAPTEGAAPLKVTATSAADGSVHTLVLSKHLLAGTYLRHMRSLLASLGAAPGDSLCLEPAGPLAVRASLVKGPADAAAAVPGEESQEVGPVPRSAWQGLEPTDSRRYTMGLSVSSFNVGRVTIPARYCVAAFGQAPVPGAGRLEVTATSTADGSTHSLRLSVRQSCLHLCRLSRLLASLGAARGDSLCLEPAGPLAVRASLVKAPAAAAEVALEEQQEQQQEQQLTASGHSTPGTAAGGGGSAAAAPPDPGSLQNDAARL